MKNRIKSIISHLERKRITKTRVREAYFVRDSRYLRRAYIRGSDFLKPSIVNYLGELPRQENFNFLYHELKTVESIPLKTTIYVSLMNLVLIGTSIQITDQESEHLYENIGLLDNLQLDCPNQEIKKPLLKPIEFRSRLKDHLGLLEEIKQQFRPI